METNFTSNSWEQSLAQVQKVNPRPELFNRIQNSIHAHEKVSNVTVWLVAASLIALVAVNFLILQNNTTKAASPLTYMEASLNQSNQLYH